MSGIFTTAYGSAKGLRTAAADCSCPVCQGLQTFSSPLYATGATLTADDLSSEQAFVRAKMRLHNKHLHGWGTVCGLQVVCDDCDGVVRVRPGYAIDPCGNDIVLAEAAPFDIIKAIQDCTNRRPKIGDCDPYQPAPDPGCRDVDTYWCVTLRFKEVQTAQTAQFMRQAAPNAGCGCGRGARCTCGGAGGGGCACGGKGGCTCGQMGRTATVSSLGYVTPNCTPRRLLECVEIGIEPHSGPCAPGLTLDRESSLLNDRFAVFGGLATLAPEGSLLRRLILCAEDAIAILGKRLTANDAAALEALGTGTFGNVTAKAMHDALCRLRQALLDFMTCHDPVRCQMVLAAGGLTVPEVHDSALVPVGATTVGGAAVGGAETGAAYAQRAGPVTRDLLMGWLQALADCACGALLPPCPTDPHDMRVPIACVTVRGGKIVDICNHACRHYAGSFPSMFYWLSLVPVVPILSRAIAALCCGPDAITPAKPNRLWAAVEAFDTTGAWRKAVMRNRFAMPATILKMAGNFDFATLVAKLRPTTDPVETLTSIGQPAEAVQAALARQGVEVQTVAVSDSQAATASLRSLASGIVASGARLNLMVNSGTVVGVAPASESEDLKAQIASLTARINLLEAGRHS